MIVNTPFILGIEGGGSHCRAILGNADTACKIDSLIVKQSASASYPDISKTIQTLKHTIDKMLTKHSLSCEDVHIALCLPGACHTENIMIIKQTIEQYYKCSIAITGDSTAALFAAYGDLIDKTGILIAGTGCNIVGFKHSYLYQYRGDGYPNDAFGGSGFVYQALCYLAETRLETRRNILDAMPTVEKFVKSSHLQWDHMKADLEECSANEVAALFPILLTYIQSDHCEEGIKKLFHKIIAHCAIDLFDFFKTTEICKFALIGSVANNIAPYLKTIISPEIEIVTSHHDPILGALLYARYSLENPDISDIQTHYYKDLNHTKKD